MIVAWRGEDLHVELNYRLRFRFRQQVHLLKVHADQARVTADATTRSSVRTAVPTLLTIRNPCCITPSIACRRTVHVESYSLYKVSCGHREVSA